MRPEHFAYLVDPLTKQPLSLTVESQDGPHVIEGRLYSVTHEYRITSGIPRLMPASSATPASFKMHQQKTADSFAYEWNSIYEENNFEKNNFLHFLSPFIEADKLVDKCLLDVGCGSGRFTKQAALCSARLVIGTDVGNSVEAAFRLTRDLPNVCIVQADVYHMPVNCFADLTFSIGVLHHLPEPEAGFRKLPQTVKPGGRLLIWVYNRRHNFRAVYVFETIRKISRHIPRPLLHRLVYAPAAAVHAINYATRGLKYLGAHRLAQKIPFTYYANFPFSMKLSDSFDVLATPRSYYFLVEEVRQWYKSAQLSAIQCYEHPEAGITCIGLLEQASDELQRVR